MIKDTLSKIETIISRVGELDSPDKAELLALLGKMKAEITALPVSRTEEASSLANFAQAAAHEASRKNGDERLRELSIEALSRSVKSFEASHPALVDTVNDICLMLSRIGI